MGKDIDPMRNLAKSVTVDQSSVAKVSGLDQWLRKSIPLTFRS